MAEPPIILPESHPLPELQNNVPHAAAAAVKAPKEKAPWFFSHSQTVWQHLQINPVPSGFDYMRLTLAILVILVHTITVSYDKSVEDAIIWSLPLRGFCRSILCIFFALSGFLVSGSVFRTKAVSEFVVLRLMRLMPALVVEVTLSAVVLGGALTIFPTSFYYHTPEFRDYFQNLIGDMHFYLPGVFITNPHHVVNITLWTLPAELGCYASLTLFMILGLIQKRTIVFYIIFYATLVMYGNDQLHVPDGPDIGAVGNDVLVLSFLWGVTIYLYGDVVKLNGTLALASFIIGIGILFDKKILLLSTPFIAYATVYIGFFNPRRLRLLFSGDYSYGLYLYAFPIQQTIFYLLPFTRNWWMNFLFGLPAAALFAAFSWHCIEKRVLRCKRFVTGPNSYLLLGERKLTRIVKAIYAWLIAMATDPAALYSLKRTLPSNGSVTVPKEKAKAEI